MEKYVVVRWPESQELMEEKGFESHSYLINDDQGLEDFGDQAYFVEEDWYNKVLRSEDRMKLVDMKYLAYLLRRDDMLSSLESFDVEDWELYMDAYKDKPHQDYIKLSDSELTKSFDDA